MRSASAMFDVDFGCQQENIMQATRRAHRVRPPYGKPKRERAARVLRLRACPLKTRPHRVRLPLDVGDVKCPLHPTYTLRVGASKHGIRSTPRAVSGLSLARRPCLRSALRWKDSNVRDALHCLSIFLAVCRESWLLPSLRWRCTCSNKRRRPRRCPPLSLASTH